MKKPELYKLEKCEDAVIVYRTDNNYGRQGVVFKHMIRYEYTPYLIPKYIIAKCHEMLNAAN